MNDSPPISLRVGAKAHTGKVREENQDRISRFRCPFGEVFIVADGMGGHEGGGLAAQMLVTGLEKALQELPRETPPDHALQTAASRVNAEIHQRAGSGDHKMGATSVLALVDGGRVQIAHAGDSRAYLFRDGRLSRLTRDHTVVQRMLDHNMLSPEEARDHPDASVVTRAFGQKPEIELEIAAPFELHSGDRVLLCSDGLCGYVDDAAIQRVLEAAGVDAQATTDALIDLALRAGGEDNVSVQLLAAQGAGGSAAALPMAPRMTANGKSRKLGPVWIGVLLVLALLAGALIPWRKIFSPGPPGKRPATTRPQKRETSPSTPRQKREIPATSGQEGLDGDEPIPLAKVLGQQAIEELRELVGSDAGISFTDSEQGFAKGKIYFRKEYKQQAQRFRDLLKKSLREAAAYPLSEWPSELEKRFPKVKILVVQVDDNKKPPRDGGTR